jgi:uncharacterized protein (DUF2141 family)
MNRILFAILLSSSIASATELIITIKGIQAEKDSLGCALFPAANGFPMDPKQAIRQKAKPEPMECRFDELKPGRYAVSVSVDVNENGKTDTNFLGMPTEAWGVSNNARPKLRAPKFEEAAFEIKEGEIKRIEIMVSK